MAKNLDEVVFAVTGSTAVVAKPISLAEAGLREREHLQEWVIAHPEIIGPGVMVVTFEFGHWKSASGPQKDRLDILGLGTDGRLVVTELKRDRAPDTVDMQAVKYAAMASRFSPDLLAEYHSKFTHRVGPNGVGAPLSEDEALAKLETWSGVGLLPELLVNPRIVLLAEYFPDSVTNTAVWLNERGVSLTLMCYHAYQLDTGQKVLTVSRLYPVREVADFVTGPVSGNQGTVATTPYQEVPWSPEDLAVLAGVENETAIAVLDLCALSPETWVPAADIYERAQVTQRVGSGKLGGFGLTVRSKLKRSNPPYRVQWNACGGNQQYYQMSADLAGAWRDIRGSDISTALTDPTGSFQDGVDDGASPTNT